MKDPETVAETDEIFQRMRNTLERMTDGRT